MIQLIHIVFQQVANAGVQCINNRIVALSRHYFSQLIQNLLTQMKEKIVPCQETINAECCVLIQIFEQPCNKLFRLVIANDVCNDFYKNIKNNQSYFEANANAKLDFLKDKSISNAKKSPYYWSAFVYYGGIEAAEKPTNYSFYILRLLILIGLFLVFKHFRK